MTKTWTLLEPDITTALQQYERPLESLAAGDIPAIVLRGAYSTEACRELIRLLVAEELLFDPHGNVPDQFREQAIPEGYYREGRNQTAQQAWRSQTEDGNLRIDIGTSLGYRGSDREAFLEHAAETRALFARLFAGRPDPVRCIYDGLQSLSVDKRVVTAREADGREYGPAIIRAHYGGYSYHPHFDSVRLREKREDFAVHEFEHQFAGVLVLQNSQRGERTAQCRLHQYLWQPEVDPHLRNNTFPEFAAERNIDSVEVCLEPGDLYFFNTRGIHEVPGVAGDLPRIVVATFIGFSSDRDEIFVWS